MNWPTWVRTSLSASRALLVSAQLSELRSWRLANTAKIARTVSTVPTTSRARTVYRRPRGRRGAEGSSMRSLRRTLPAPAHAHNRARLRVPLGSAPRGGTCPHPCARTRARTGSEHAHRAARLRLAAHLGDHAVRGDPPSRPDDRREGRVGAGHP